MASKKLQTEIDRTLKKVSEGLDIFQETLDKLNNATTPNQKEKYEVDLKKEIKKLQRLRDTIKGWQTSSEIKDKSTINDARKLIEAQMERFKVLEKEMKIKAFSKEGLNQATKLDPKAKERLDLSTWINGVVDKLNTQIDVYEAESETMGLNLKKGKKLEAAKQSRQDLLQKSTESHKDHIYKLEAILRLMENDQVSTEQVSALRDEVDYYIEAHLEDDYVSNDAMYEDFDFSSTLESDSDSYSDESDHEHVASRKKSIEPERVEKPAVQAAPVPTQAKPQPIVSAPARPVPTVLAPHSREPEQTPTKVVSPPPVTQLASVTRLSGPSFASALAAVTAASASVSSSSQPSRAGSLNKSTPHDSRLRLFEELDGFFAKRFPGSLVRQNALQYLTASYQHLPENYELERNRHFSPKQPYAMPSYYQSEPPAILSNPSIFERFDLDTLFFIFYYQQKTYPQYLAARELKKQSWRFHKKYLTWFQRHEEPKVITNDYEQGTYVYFDYEGSWCQRKKTEFTFEYRYLEDEELI